MNCGKTIFSQLISLLPSNEFCKCVERYGGNYKIKTFSCWDQFLCMVFYAADVSRKPQRYPGMPARILLQIIAHGNAWQSLA